MTSAVAVLSIPSRDRQVAYTEAADTPPDARFGNNLNHIATQSSSTQATMDLLAMASFYHQDENNLGEWEDNAAVDAQFPTKEADDVYFNETTGTWFERNGGNDAWVDTESATVPSGRSAIDPATGWPLAGTTKVTLEAFGNGLRFESGTYTFSHNGSGSLNGGNSVVIDGSTGTLTLTFTGEIYEPELRRAGDTDTFTESILERNANFSCIRFLNWTRGVNESDHYRPQYPRVLYERPANAFYHRTPSWGVMREFAEEVGADAWINIPHLASETEIAAAVTAWTGFANTLYVEHSNEVWNNQFPVFNYSLARALEEPYASMGIGVYQTAQAWHADRTDEIGEQFLAEIPTCVPVLGQQFAIISYAQTGITYGTRWPYPNIKAYGIAPYYSRSKVGPPSSITVEEIESMTDQEFADFVYADVASRVEPLMDQWVALCNSRNVRCLCYESSLSMLHGNSAIQAALDARAQLVEHGPHYTSYYNMLFAKTNDLINLYRLTGADSSGRYSCSLYEKSRPVTGKYPAVQALATTYNS